MNWSTEKINATNEQILRDVNISNLLNEESEFPKSDPFFKNNPCIRASNIPFDLTSEEIKCINKLNNARFLANFCNLKLRDYQEKAIDNYQSNRFNLIVNSRQTGITSILSLKALHFILSNKNKSIAIFSSKIDSSVEIISKIKELYLKMPFYAKPGVKLWNQKTIKFDNDCIVKCYTNKNVDFDHKIHFCIVDGLSHFWNVHYFCQKIFPTIYSDTDSKISIVSSPNGNNYFKKLVDTDIMFNKQWIYWHQVPNRGLDWKKETIKDIGGIEAFAQEYELLFSGSVEWNRYLNLEKLR
jgi:hypothetical protein